MSTNKFKKEVINKLEYLYNNGITIVGIDNTNANTTFTINKVINIYVKKMKLKYSNLGELYLKNMIKDIENIINNLDIKSTYDTIEFVNNIINYCNNSLHFTYKKIEKEPNLPDYTISEIREIAKHL